MRDISFVPAAAMSIVVVFGLFLGMQAMINVDLGEPDPVVIFKGINIWQEPPPPLPPPEELTKPQDPLKPPPAARPQMEIEGNQGPIIDIRPHLVAPPTEQIFISDNSALIPLVAVQPNYPGRALERGIEGYCVVSFTITAAGTTRDIAELECSNSVFLRDSIRAAERLRYSPRIINGRPVEVEHRYKFSFEMSQ
jgi:protein TonB